MDSAFPIRFTSRIVLPPDFSRILRVGAEQLQQEAQRFAGLTPEILCGTARQGDIALLFTEAQEKEAYHLSVQPDIVRILSGSDIGMLHGVQTLRQLIRQAGGLLPNCEIDDAPCFPARGFYHDISRGRMPTLDTLKKIADDACFFKLNQLQLYIEHTYLFRDLSEMWRIGRPLTAQEILELDAYCADRGIELVPSLSCFGHLFELLHTKGYGHLCEMENTADIPSTMINRMRHHTLNISDPRSFDLVSQMIDEFMPLFSSRKFNLCADETFDLGKGRGRKAMEEVGEGAYYIGFVKRLCDFIVAKGRQPMFWGDIVAKFPQVIRELPEGVICLNWDYSRSVTEDVTRALKEAGAVQYVCPGVAGWNQWLNLLPDSYENIARMADYGRKYGAIGLLNTDWGDYGHINDPALSVPGLIYGAVMSWQNENPPMDRLNADISRLYYLDSSGTVMDALAQAQSCDICSWRQLVRYKDWRQGVFEQESPLPPVSDRAVRQADDKLSRIEHTLRAACPGMDTSARGMLTLWLTALEGIHLCNHAGNQVSQGRKNPALAAQMENWFRQYETVWRASCHEAELWRIRDVIYWYADLLR